MKENKKEEVLPVGLDMSPEQLFFVSSVQVSSVQILCKSLSIIFKHNFICLPLPLFFVPSIFNSLQTNTQSYLHAEGLHTCTILVTLLIFTFSY